MKEKIIAMAMLSALSFFYLYAPCQAEEPTEGIRRMLEDMMSIQGDPELQGHEFREVRRIAIKKVIAKNFDFDAMAEQSLGRYWQELNGAQRTEFKGIFQDLFQDSYTRLVLDFLRQETILYTEEDINQGRAVVKTTILRTHEEIPVDYFLSLVNEEWLVHDVKIDGVSIVQNYRKSFGRVIKRESYQILLQKMRLQLQAIEKSS
ncbi:MAG: ABC transporter substrate-binding protein [Deltaproteobacteria bacterium]|nr:ABC transporter substrate-binding protein [Deltaproteobacteria bacterium]